MSKMFIGRFVASILALLIASGVLLTNGQSQSGVLSDEDEAEILESLIQLEFKPLGSEFGSIWMFLVRQHRFGFSDADSETRLLLMATGEIKRLRQEYVVDYVVIRSIYRRDGIVVVRLSAVTEGRPCFAPAFSRERSFTYEYQKNLRGLVGKLVKRPVPFPFTRSLATTP